MKVRHSLSLSALLIIVLLLSMTVPAGQNALTLGSEEGFTVAAGDTIHLYFEIGGRKTTEQPTEWKSSNTKTAIVSSSGEVTGVSAGTVEISANTKYGWISETITVTAARSSSQSSNQSGSQSSGQNNGQSGQSANQSGSQTTNQTNTQTTGQDNGGTTTATTAKGRKALKAYSKLLSKKSVVLEKKRYLLSTCVFDTLYLNNNSIPELFIRVSRDEGSATIFRWALYTYKNGKAKLVHTSNMGILGGYGNDFSYYRKKGIFCEQYTHGDNRDTCYRKMKGTSLKPVLSIYEGYDYEMDGWDPTYYKYYKADWKKTTKNAFDKALKKYVGSVQETKLVLHTNNAVSREMYLK